jgi:hypothetical protein
MSNDEIQMTKEIQMSNDEILMTKRSLNVEARMSNQRQSAFVIWLSSFLRHFVFVIRHFLISPTLAT